jgi:hypothetical protein
MWVRTAAALVFGYLTLGRAFAYLGIPPWKIFIGEALLLLFVVAGPTMHGARWLRLTARIPALKPLLTWYGLFLAYGILQVLHGIWVGNPPLLALRDLAFNYYPVYFFLGIWAGLNRPHLLPRLLRAFAWFNGIYGMLFLLFLNRLNWFFPGVSDEIAPVPIFGQPIYSFVALLGLLAYEKELKRSWFLLLLNALVMFGMQFRTEWLAFAVGVSTWCFITRQGKRVLKAAAVFACLFAVLYVSDFSLPSPQGRAEADFSARQLVDRAVAPFRADLADQTTAAGGIAVDSQEATFVWRTVWWLAIWDSVHSDARTAVWGYGYGFALGDLVPYLRGEFIRTPHNEFFYALGYTGWVGVVLFSLFQFGLLRLLLQSWRATGDAFGLTFWFGMAAFSMFFPLGETPYGAIPFYVVAGWVVAPVVSGKQAIGTDTVAETPLRGPRACHPVVTTLEWR